MKIDKTGKILICIWVGCGIASSWISLLFDHAGKVTFGLAVIGIAVLAISCVREIRLARKRFKEQNSQ